MKKALLIFVISSAFNSIVNAQYVPNTGQAFQFYSMYNPAFSGIDEFMSFKLDYGYRWAGIPNAPKAINFSFDMRIKKPVDFQTNSLRISNMQAVNIPKRKLIIGGMNVSLFQTTYGAVETQGLSYSIAAHYPLSKKVKLSGGITAIVENTKFDLNNVTVRDQDLYFQSLVANGSSKTNFNLRAGLLLYASKFYLGFSYFPVFQTNLQHAGINDDSPAVYKGSVQAGYSLVFSPDFTIKPSVMGLLKTAGGVSLDYNVKAYIQRKAWVGITYRDIKSLVVSLGMNINHSLSANYSYEKSLGKFKQFNDGSHELVLFLRINNLKKKDPYAW